MSAPKYIWYACYGSNLSYDRFMCYIRGGQPRGSSKINVGCRDSSVPVKTGSLTIRYELFFARNSGSWSDGGVAFVNPAETENSNSYCKIYLITQEQFEDIFKQENDLDTMVSIDFDDVRMKKSNSVNADIWYPTILYLGIKDGYPIFTITSNAPNLKPQKPSLEYLVTIIHGLFEINLQKSKIVSYLTGLTGIKEFFTPFEIKSLTDKM